MAMMSGRLLERLMAALGLLGVIGLWIAAFQNPSRPTKWLRYTNVLLACGLAVGAPWLGILLFATLKDPLSLQELRKYWHFYLTFFGPVLCCVYFYGRQLLRI
jgi:hypothetical protein